MIRNTATSAVKRIGLLGTRSSKTATCARAAPQSSPPGSANAATAPEPRSRLQLDYREENKTAVAAFHPTRKLGKYTKLLMDEEAKKFAVTSASDLTKANPDILDYSQAGDCRLNIDESRHELKQKDAEGKLVSYDPPQYEYSYDFHVEIDVEHLCIDTIRYSLSNGYIKTGDRPELLTTGAWQVNTADSTNYRLQDYYAVLNLGNEIKDAVEETLGPRPGTRQVLGRTSKPDGSQPKQDPALVPRPPPPRKRRSALWCGLTTVPDANGCCEFCTGTLC